MTTNTSHESIVAFLNSDVRYRARSLPATVAWYTDVAGTPNNESALYELLKAIADNVVHLYRGTDSSRVYVVAGPKPGTCDHGVRYGASHAEQDDTAWIA